MLHSLNSASTFRYNLVFRQALHIYMRKPMKECWKLMTMRFYYILSRHCRLEGGCQLPVMLLYIVRSNSGEIFIVQIMVISRNYTALNVTGCDFIDRNMIATEKS